MIRPNLLAWQWSDYAAKHRDRENLLLHLASSPSSGSRFRASS
jgi:hypothetical protein